MAKRHGTLAGLAALLLFLSPLACRQDGSPGESDAGRSADTPGPPLRLALLPVLDVLPFFVAGEKGYFAEEGVEVSAIPVASALERDQLLQAGEADGMMGELAAAAFFNREAMNIQVVMTARKAYPDAPVFRILAAPSSGLTAPSDLAGVPIAISENTIIEYITDRLLAAEGLGPEQIASRSVPSIPERFQLLMEGKISAATLPDPLAQSAVTAGAALIVDDSSHPQYAVTILAFRREIIDGRAEAVRRFLRAWDRAAADINDAPEAFRGLLLQKVRVPGNVRETYSIPPFPRAEIPSREQWDDVVSWLKDKNLLEGDSPYDSSVSADLLPRTR